jgi:hypothetical protein
MSGASVDLRFEGQSGRGLSEGVRSPPLLRSITFHYANGWDGVIGTPDPGVKKVGLTLTSEKADGERIYRVAAGKPTKSKPNPSIPAPPAA